jgi:hypothetical protein
MKILVASLLALSSMYAYSAPPAKNAESGTRYSLYQDTVTFYAPADWPAGMQKTNGTPQFIAFLIKDPDDAGNGEAAEVSVEAKVLNDASTFQALVNAGTDKAKQSQGYQALNSNNPNAMHYAALNGKQRFDYIETWYLDAKILIHVRCGRPASTGGAPTAWAAAYDTGCAQVMRTVKPH